LVCHVNAKSRHSPVSTDHTPTSQMSLIGEGAGGLSDDEAIALWDRLMASVRLRVVDR